MTDSLVPTKQVTQNEKCPVCKKRPAAEPHVCPYANMDGDNETPCTCCPECTEEHAGDI